MQARVQGRARRDFPRKRLGAYPQSVAGHLHERPARRRLHTKKQRQPHYPLVPDGRNLNGHPILQNSQQRGHPASNEMHVGNRLVWLIEDVLQPRDTGSKCGLSR